MNFLFCPVLTVSGFKWGGLELALWVPTLAPFELLHVYTKTIDLVWKWEQHNELGHLFSWRGPRKRVYTKMPSNVSRFFFFFFFQLLSSRVKPCLPFFPLALGLYSVHSHAKPSSGYKLGDLIHQHVPQLSCGFGYLGGTHFKTAVSIHLLVLEPTQCNDCPVKCSLKQ